MPAELAKTNWMPVTVAGSTPLGSATAGPGTNGPAMKFVHGAGRGAVLHRYLVGAGRHLLTGPIEAR